MMRRLEEIAKHSFDMFRYFESPSITFLARAGLFKIRYCSYNIRKNGHRYLLLGRPLGGDHRILREVLIDETYAPILPLLPATPLGVLDVGAHIGSFITWLSERKLVREAYCLEPEPESFKLCCFNLADKANVDVARLALGGTSRQSKIWTDPQAHARSTIIEGMRRPTNTELKETSVLSLAEWVKDHPGAWDLLKMDCEGAEWEVLRDCPDALSQFSVIVAEIHYDPAEQRSKRDFADRMKQLGFRLIPNDRLLLAVKNY